MANNPDNFVFGARVRLNRDGVQQFPTMKKYIGTISAKQYGIIIAIKWDHKKSQDRFHIDLLKLVKRASKP